MSMSEAGAGAGSGPDAVSRGSEDAKGSGLQPLVLSRLPAAFTDEIPIKPDPDAPKPKPQPAAASGSGGSDGSGAGGSAGSKRVKAGPKMEADLLLPDDAKTDPPAAAALAIVSTVMSWLTEKEAGVLALASRPLARLVTANEPYWKAATVAQFPEMEHRSATTNWIDAYRRKTTEERTSFKDITSDGELSRCAFFSCPNGHLYALGECRMPVFMARCASCGARIGGGNHTIRRDNRRWKQQALVQQVGGAETDVARINADRLRDVVQATDRANDASLFDLSVPVEDFDDEGRSTRTRGGGFRRLFSGAPAPPPRTIPPVVAASRAAAAEAAEAAEAATAATAATATPAGEVEAPTSEADSKDAGGGGGAGAGGEADAVAGAGRGDLDGGGFYPDGLEDEDDDLGGTTNGGVSPIMDGDPTAGMGLCGDGDDDDDGEPGMLMDDLMVVGQPLVLGGTSAFPHEAEAKTK